MVTVGDIARDAEVSPGTVSHALSGRRPIAPEARRRIEQSIRRLAHHPGHGARAPAGRRTGQLAMAVPLRADVHLPVVLRYVGAALAAARRHGSDLLLLTGDGSGNDSSGNDSSELVGVADRADALIVTDVRADEPRVPVLRALACPVVLIGVPAQPHDLTCVDLDFAAAGRLAAQRLAELRHRQVALIGPSPTVYERGTSHAGRLLGGFRSAAAEHGLAAGCYPCVPTYAGARACLDAVLHAQPTVTGLVVHNEAVLAPLLTELGHRGLRVPADVSIIAVCPDDLARQPGITLTSVTVPAAELGRLAVDLALEPAGGRVAGSTAGPGVRLLPPRLTTRDSTSPTRRGRRR